MNRRNYRWKIGRIIAEIIAERIAEIIIALRIAEQIAGIIGGIKSAEELVELQWHCRCGYAKLPTKKELKELKELGKDLIKELKGYETSGLASLRIKIYIYLYIFTASCSQH